MTDQDNLVHRGKDGWLFLIGGSNNVIDYYINPNAFPDRLVKNWANILNSRRQRSGEIDCRYLHLIAPDKLSVYPEFYRGDLPYLGRSPAHILPLWLRDHDDSKGSTLVDVLPLFREKKKTTSLYYKTDSHWTFYGCYVAYCELCRRLGARPNEEILNGPVQKVDLVLDLGVKCEPAVRETFVMADFLKGARRVSAGLIVNYKERNKRQNDIGLHVGSNVVYVNESASADPRKIVLFGDSFSEYRPRLLTGMLAETFREVHFIWSVGVDWKYVESIRPDILVTEAAERFMGSPPADRFDLDAYVVRKLAPLLT